MTMPIASLFGLAGWLGMIVARFLGTSAAVNNLLVASFVCLVLAGLLVLVHFTINFWFELNRTAEGE
jgi:hypothetical protein